MILNVGHPGVFNIHAKKLSWPAFPSLWSQKFFLMFFRPQPLNLNNFNVLNHFAMWHFFAFVLASGSSEI